MSRENFTKGMTEEQIKDTIERQNMLMDDMLETLSLKNDAALARVMRVSPPIISKLRAGRLFFNSSYQITAHELTDWSISSIRKALNIPSVPDLNAADEKALAELRAAGKKNVSKTTSPTNGA